MIKNQRNLLMELILMCDKESYTLLNYHIGGGVIELPDLVEVINEYGNCFKFEYNLENNCWNRIKVEEEQKLVSTHEYGEELKKNKAEGECSRAGYFNVNI